MLRLERAVVVAFAVLLLSYLVWLPSFEGPDEPEHIAHVRAWATGASIEVPAEGTRPEWGYQIVQPPLYYALAGVWSRVVGPEFTDAIAINPTQNPGFPFIRHDVEGERFPWSGAHRGLRWLRLPSVVFGLLTAWVLVWMGRELFGSDSWSRALWLAAVLLTPNIVQAFASVSNDGLAILAASVGLAAAVAVIRSEGPATRWAGLCGLALGIAIGIKLTAVIAAATAATILVVDAVRKKDLRTTLTTLAAALLPLIVCVAALLASNQLRFGDATLETVRNEMLPAFVRCRCRWRGSCAESSSSFLRRSGWTSPGRRSGFPASVLLFLGCGSPPASPPARASCCADRTSRPAGSAGSAGSRCSGR